MLTCVCPETSLLRTCSSGTFCRPRASSNSLKATSNACNYTNWTMQGGLTWKALRQSRLVISSFETRSKDATINCSTIQLQNESSNLQPKFTKAEHFRASSAPSSGATEALKQQASINFGWHFMSFNSVSWANQAGLCRMLTFDNFETAQIKSENCRRNLSGLQSCLHSLLSQILWKFLWETKKRTSQIIMLASNFTTGSSTSLRDIKKKKKKLHKTVTVVT